MRTPQRVVNRRFKLSAASLPAPVLGLNTQDALSAGREGYALKLDNFVISPSGIEVRKSTGTVCALPAAPETLAAYVYGQQKKLFACAGGKIYDCDVAAGRASVVKDGLANNRWQTLFYEGYLYFVNGNDLPLVYTPQGALNPAEFTQATPEGLTPFDPRRLAAGCVYKNRLIFLERGGMAFHYTAAAGAKTGELKKFDLGQMAHHGGELVWALPWTYASAGGAQESQLVFMSSEGEAFIYAGDDPGNIDAWTLRGTYQTPRPQGRRAATAAGSDIAYAAENGYYMLSDLLSTPVAQRAVAFSDAINNQVAGLKTRFGQFGWELTLCSAQNMLVANVPQGAHTVQHILNTQTGGWSRFTGIDALCWCVLDGELYLGTAEGVQKYGALSQKDIRWSFELAFRNLGTPLLKVIKTLQVYLQAYKSLKFTLTAAVDFGPAAQIYQSSPGAAAATWDKSDWDKTPWEAEQSALRVSVTPAVRPGQYFSFGASGQTAGQPVQFISMTAAFETGRLN